MLPVLFQIGVGFGSFPQIIQNMTSLGFFQFLFPFLLALGIFYGILKWGLHKKFPNSAIGLISLILSFFVMLFASANPGIVGFLQNISGTGLIVGTGILFLIVLLGLTGFSISDILDKGKEEKGKSGYIVLLLAILAIVIVLFFGAGTYFMLPGVYIGSDFWTVIFFVVILAIVLWAMGKGGESEPATQNAGPPGRR